MKIPEGDKLVITQVNEERFQRHSTRAKLYSTLEATLKLPVVSFCTSFVYPVLIEDSDADLLEGVLQKSQIKEGFALLLSSPGGHGLAAERIIKVCRAYGGKSGYKVIVPGKAKSAATIVCFGANEVIMGRTSELGPIDPQIRIKEGEEQKSFSLFNVVKSYDNLFDRAVKEKGNLQPYLQQLARYDEREIEECRSVLALSEDMAVKALETGMMSGLGKGNARREEIRKRIGVFLSPEEVKVHGRAIYADEARKCGLNVRIEDVKSDFWASVYELYVRLNNFVSHDNVVKCIESGVHSFAATARLRSSS